MKKIVSLAILICLLLAAGCTSSPSGTPVSPNPVVSGKALTDPVLPMDGQVTLGSGNKTFNVSLDSIEVDPVTEPGKHTITIYVLARNTGTEPIQLVWFSKLTNTYGNSFGGIGISHQGTGARTRNISPGTGGEAARDYVVIHSDESFATLSKGAVLDVYFMEKGSDEISLVPDYHVAWTVDPGVIR